MSFDARSAKMLAPGSHLTSDECPGLRLVATESRRSWIYRYRSPVDNKIRQFKIGSWPQMSIHAAIAAWEVLRAKRESGEDPALQAKELRREGEIKASAKKDAALTASYTVLDVCNDYWNGHIKPNRKKKGVTEVRRMFDTMLGELASAPAATITRSQAFELIQSHLNDRPVVAGYLRSELGAAWDYAIDAGRLPESSPNWWRLILRGKIKSKGKSLGGERIGVVKRVLTPKEVGELIRWMPNFPLTTADALTLYLWTATRGSEIVAMEGKDISHEDDGNWWWTIQKEKTKNANRERANDMRVPLFGRALDVVLRRMKSHGEGYLFPVRTKGQDRPIEQKTIQACVWMRQPYSETTPEVYRERLTVTHWAPHDLRRTARTFLASLGCPDAVGESILGHILPGVVGVYNRHAYDAERVVWLKRLSDYLEELASRRD